MKHGRLVILASIVCLLVGAAAPANARESAEAFLPFSGITEVVVSPNGRWIAAAAYRGDQWAVLVQQVGARKIVSVLESDWVSQLAWEAPDALIVRAGSSSGKPIVLVAHLSDAGETIGIDRRTIFAPGWLVDPLPLVDDQVLWEFEHNGWTSLHRISIRELADFSSLHRKSPRSIEIGDKLATVHGSTVTEDWIIDRRGLPRAARRRTEDGFAVLMAVQDEGPLEIVHQYKDSEPEREMVPVGLTVDGSRVIVRAYQRDDTSGLFELDPKSGALAEKVFIHPDFDVEDIVTDPLTGDLVAAAYYNSGELRYHYFQEYRDRFLAKLPAKWQGDSVEVRSGTADRRVFAFLDSNDTNPGDFYIRDATGQIQSIGRAAENVDRAKLVPVESFRVKSRDGTEVEAFLTLPRAGEGPVPLVVMPHGGPQDVADNRSYDGFLQYLASWGFAVLQVNYRGSSGYGIEFERLGKKEWARGIEDDIDSAVERPLSLCRVLQRRLGHSAALRLERHGGFEAGHGLLRGVRGRSRNRAAQVDRSLTGLSRRVARRAAAHRLRLGRSSRRPRPLASHALDARAVRKGPRISRAEGCEPFPDARRVDHLREGRAAILERAPARRRGVPARPRDLIVACGLSPDGFTARSTRRVRNTDRMRRRPPRRDCARFEAGPRGSP
jgi:hypothetical protein